MRAVRVEGWSRKNARGPAKSVRVANRRNNFVATKISYSLKLIKKLNILTANLLILGRRTFRCRTQLLLYSESTEEKWTLPTNEDPPSWQKIKKKQYDHMIKGLLTELFADRPGRIVLLKVAYYATSSARNFTKLCQNSQTMLLISEIMLTKWRRFCT